MVERDVVLAKIAVIDRCLSRIAEVRGGRGGALLPLDVETFSLLEQHGVLEASLAGRLRKMVGFRNLAIHDYQTIDPAILESIVTTRLDDLRTFAAAVAERFGVR